MGPRDADGEWRDDPTPRIRSLRLRLSVASLLLQALSIADQLSARAGKATPSGGGVLAGVAATLVVSRCGAMRLRYGVCLSDRAKGPLKLPAAGGPRPVPHSGSAKAVHAG